MFIRLVTVKGKGVNKARTRRYAQLVESFRRPQDKRPTHRVLANLGSLTDGQVDVLRRAFAAIGKSDMPVVPETSAAPLSSLSVQDNLDYLDVVVALEAWRQSRVPSVLAELVPTGDSEMLFADVIGSLVVHRCVAPDSKKAAQRWFPTTALPEVLGVPPRRLHNTRIHRALETLDDIDSSLQARLPGLLLERQSHFRALFLDVTDTWFFGRGAPLAEKAITKEGRYKYAIGIVLLCTEQGFPLRWNVVSARSTDSTVMAQMLEQVKELDWVRQVPIAMDRAMGTTASLRTLLGTSLHFVTALTTSEFDSYAAGQVPSSAVAHIDAYAPDAAQQAAQAIARAGLRRVSDTRYLRDLGIVERQSQSQSDRASATPPSGPSAEVTVPADATTPPEPLAESHTGRTVTGEAAAAQPRHGGEGNPAAQALTLAEKARALVAGDRVPSYRAAARSLSIPQQRLSDYLDLLQLAPDLQDEVRAGGARMSLTSLCRIANLADHEVQRCAFADRNVARPPKKRPRSTAASDRPQPEPVRVRAIVCFNPRLFVDARKLADETLAKIRAFERTLNERLQSPRSRRARDSVAAEIDQELRRRDLLDAFTVCLEERGGRVVHAELQLRPEPWQRRRRFDGFSVIVAHPDSLLGAEQLSAQYRDKDAVEKNFRTIKSEIELRPIWHRTDVKVRAHVTLCMLALLVDRILEQRLESSGRPVTAKTLFELLAPTRLNRCRLKGADKSWYLLTETTADQDAVLKALDMGHLVDHAALAARIVPR